eukprot:scaffold1487_cov116-Isochrysis_galbana.AAC.32
MGGRLCAAGHLLVLQRRRALLRRHPAGRRPALAPRLPGDALLHMLRAHHNLLITPIGGGPGGHPETSLDRTHSSTGPARGEHGEFSSRQVCDEGSTVWQRHDVAARSCMHGSSEKGGVRPARGTHQAYTAT